MGNGGSSESETSTQNIKQVSREILNITPPKYSVPANNWTDATNKALKPDIDSGSNNANYRISFGGQPDPASGCAKNYVATYKCGNTEKTVSISPEATGQIAVFNCTDEARSCFSNRITMMDDGNLVSSNRNGDVLWQSGAVQISDIPLEVDEYKASNTRFKANMLEQGQLISPGELLGSNNGRFAFQVSNDGSRAQVIYKMLDIESDNGKNVGINNHVAVYSVDTSVNEHLGKIGYLDMNGELREYPQKMLKLANTYTEGGNYTSSGRTVGKALNSTVEQCQQKCNSNDACFGFELSNARECKMLGEDMYPKGIRRFDASSQLFLRDDKIHPDPSCPNNIQSVTSKEWNEFAKGELMTRDTKCLLGAVSEPKSNDLKSLLNQMNALEQKIYEKTRSIQIGQERIEQATQQTSDKLAADLAEYRRIVDDYENKMKGVGAHDGMVESTFASVEQEKSMTAVWGLATAVAAGALITMAIGGSSN